MARPQKHTVDYFPHYVAHGKTLLILDNEFGNDGYAFWFKLLELLCTADGQYYATQQRASWRLLLAKTCVTEDKARAILNVLADVEAIDADLWLADGIIWVQNLVDNLELVYRRRSDGMPTKPVIANTNPPITLVSDSIKPQTKLNKTKLNKTTGGGAKNTSVAITVDGKDIGLVPAKWLDTLKDEFAGMDMDAELRKFADYWYMGPRRPPKNLCLALRNWFTKAREIKARGDNGGKGAASSNEIKEAWG